MRKERSRLSGAAFDLDEFSRFLARNWSPGVVRTVMKAVEPLWDGTGITHDRATGTFYGRGHGVWARRSAWTRTSWHSEPPQSSGYHLVHKDPAVGMIPHEDGL